MPFDLEALMSRFGGRMPDWFDRLPPPVPPPGRGPGFMMWGPEQMGGGGAPSALWQGGGLPGPGIPPMDHSAMPGSGPRPIMPGGVDMPGSGPRPIMGGGGRWAAASLGGGAHKQPGARLPDWLTQQLMAEFKGGAKTKTNSGIRPGQTTAKKHVVKRPKKRKKGVK